MYLIFIALGILLLFPITRCFLFNLPFVFYYFFRDIFFYFKFKAWENFSLFGIDLFCGMFGHGKTLSMVHKSRCLYKTYGDKLRFISNIKLTDIPYIPLVNFNQLVDLGESDDDSYIGTVVIIDEIENVLNNRNYAKFPLAMLHMLTQQRKKKVYIMATAQRFFMVDKLFRSITTRVIDCNKIWRFQRFAIYDAWDYECAVNPNIIKPYAVGCWFVHNIDYESYDTSEMVKKCSAENFISNLETLERQGVVVPVGDSQIINPSSRFKKGNKKK